MRIRTFALGPLETNGYLLDQGGQAVFIDPGGDPVRVVQTISSEGLGLTHILNTHLHFDHILGNRALAEATGALVLAGPGDDFLLQTEMGRGGFMGFPAVPCFSYEDLVAGEREFLGLACHVLDTPGHTPGHLAFYFPAAKAVFSGDLLFRRSIGRTDFPGGDMDALVASVRDKIFTLPGETVVYSGHGPETTVAEETIHNPFFQVGP